MHPKSNGFLESSLYVDNVAASARFYARIFGFPIVSDFGERGCAMKAGEGQVLLLFKKGGSLSVPSPHDGDGELHIAFAIPASELARWESWLEENGVAIAERRTWDLGGQSIYFRDPDRHLLEIASPGVWSIY
jgi:catechol 2,3-dioxygenase-like lactoylglutathione lyase family enzyme